MNLHNEYQHRQPVQRMNISDPQAKTYDGQISLIKNEVTTFEEATNSKYAEEWMTAMDEEISMLIKQGTFQLVPQKQDMNVISTK